METRLSEGRVGKTKLKLTNTSHVTVTHLGTTGPRYPWPCCPARTATKITNMNPSVKTTLRTIYDKVNRMLWEKNTHHSIHANASSAFSWPQ